ncbi:MAG TPA: hypothetical protein VM013_03475 [Dehalococcoidia bacterium]|nr:hypothetical protein [Dehalococcoidia bacterium]
MTRQPAGRSRDKRKGRRRPVPPRPPATTRPRVAPIGASTEVEEPATSAKKLKAANPMDFRYVNAELRRILVFIVGMLGLLIVLSIVLR